MKNRLKTFAKDHRKEIAVTVAVVVAGVKIARAANTASNNIAAGKTMLRSLDALSSQETDVVNITMKKTGEVFRMTRA